MRRVAAPLWALVAMTALMAVVPTATAQFPFGDPLVEDSPGDVMLVVPDGPEQPAPAGMGMDLLGVWTYEDPLDLRFRVQVADLSRDGVGEGGAVYISFLAEERTYLVAISVSGDTEGGTFGNLIEVTGQGQWRFVQSLRAYSDPDEGHLWTSVPRDALVTGMGRPLQAGDALQEVYAWSTSLNAGVDARDRAPDAGFAPDVPLTWVRNTGEGALRLSSSDAFRASNGEATTYRFTVRADNTGDDERLLRLSHGDVPTGWNVTLPDGVLRLPAGERAWFRIFVDTPFNHIHGQTQAFTLRLDGADDPSTWAEIQLGVHYLAVPHPAGHHDTIRLHSHAWSTVATAVNPVLGGSTGYLTMNTLEDDPSDNGQPLEAWASINGETYYGWSACLDPGLAMGLDFDLERTGMAALAFETQGPIQGARLEGWLAVVPKEPLGQWCAGSAVPEDEKVRVATFTADLGDIGPAQECLVETAIVPQEAGDFVPFDPETQLVLEVRIVGTNPPLWSLPPKLLPGASLQLPLNEYFEPTGTPVFEDAGAGSAPGGTREGEFKAEDDGSEGAPGVGAVGLAALLLAAIAVHRTRRRS